MATTLPQGHRFLSTHIPEELFIRTKIESVKRGISFTKVFEQALTGWLKTSPGSKQARVRSKPAQAKARKAAPSKKPARKRASSKPVSSTAEASGKQVAA